MAAGIDTDMGPIEDNLQYLVRILEKDTEGFRLLLLYAGRDSAEQAVDVGRFTSNNGVLRIYPLDSPAREPYFPFLRMVLESAGPVNMYPAQKELWEQVAQDKPVRRGEEVLPGEREYEYGKLIDTLHHSLAEALSPGELIFIPNGHHLRQASVDVIEALAAGESPMFIILSMDPAISPELSDRLSQLAETHGAVLDLGDDISRKHHEPPSPSNILSGSPLQRAYSAFHFMDYSCAEYLLQLAAEGEPDSAIELLKGRIFLKKSLDGDALTSFQNALTCAQHEGDDLAVAESYYQLARVYFDREDLSQCEAMVRLCAKNAGVVSDPRLLFYADFFRFLIEDKQRKFSPESFRQQYFNLLSAAESLGYHLSYVYVSVNPFGLYSNYDAEIEAQHARGIELCRELGNEHLLAFGFQTLGLANAVQGRYSEVLPYYEKNLELTKKLGHPLQIAYSRNGLGFFNYLMGEYDEAQRQYRQALSLLLNCDDLHEIGMTLFNMGMNALLARKAEQAMQFFKFCLELLETRGRRNLAYHSELGILVAYAVACYNAGNWAKAWQIDVDITRKKLKPIPDKNEEYFLLHMLEARKHEQHGDFAEALRCFDEAREFLYRKNDNISYFEAFFMYEMQAFYGRREDSQARNAQLDALKKSLKKRQNSFYTELIDGKNSTEDEFWDIEGTLSSVVQKARQDRELNRMYGKMRELQLVRDIQELFVHADQRSDLIRQLIDRIFSTLDVREVGFRKSGKSGDYYLRCIPDEHPDPLRLFSSALPSENRDEIVRITVRGESGEYGILAMRFPAEDSSQEDSAQLLPIIASQLALAFERIGQLELIEKQNSRLQISNQELRKRSLTDPLTNIGNRAALRQSLNRYCAVYRRSDTRGLFSLLFIDLDNFKIVNDLLGHDQGDELLKAVVNEMGRQVRESDEPFRFGGDEFILLLPATDGDGAEKTAEKLINSLRAENLMPPEQLKLIPERRRMSVSIGVVCPNDMPSVQIRAEDLLGIADQEMYTAKKQGKNRYSRFRSE